MNIEKNSFGKFEEWLLSNRSNGDVVKIVPAAGGVIRHMKLNGKAIISGPDNEEELTEDNSYQSAVLFPWGNRIKNGKYTFGDCDYQLPINEAGANNALHGFVHDQAFTVSGNFADDDKCGLLLQYVGDGSFEGYPFPFKLQVTVTLRRNSKVNIDFKVQNTGLMEMPCVLGWHPYFQFGGETANDWEIRFPAGVKYEPDACNIPVDSKAVAGVGDYVLEVKDKYLNEVFRLKPAQGTATTELYSKITGYAIRLSQSMGLDQFNFLVIYTPPHRKSIAIEPMSGCVDAFNNRDGLISIAPGAAVRLQVGLEVVV